MPYAPFTTLNDTESVLKPLNSLTFSRASGGMPSQKAGRHVNTIASK
jgi:hypothetical protein